AERSAQDSAVAIAGEVLAVLGRELAVHPRGMDAAAAGNEPVRAGREVVDAFGALVSHGVGIERHEVRGVAGRDAAPPLQAVDLRGMAREAPDALLEGERAHLAYPVAQQVRRPDRVTQLVAVRAGVRQRYQHPRRRTDEPLQLGLVVVRLDDL